MYINVVAGIYSSVVYSLPGLATVVIYRIWKLENRK
jgi:hypothetical protein